MDSMPFGLLSAIVGLFGGIVLGLAARLGDFCTLGALEAAYYGGDQKRLRMWGIALGVAILGTFSLDAAGFLNVKESLYLSTKWNPAASIVGGLMFGYGMAYAGNCGFGALSRFGGGDLRSMIVVIVIAIFSFITLGGPLAPLRAYLFPTTLSENPSGFAHSISEATSVPPIAIAILVSLVFFGWAFSHAGLRASKRNIFWAAMAGLAIVSAWWGTAYLKQESFGAIPVVGHSFTAPLGRTLLFLMTSTAGGLNFAVGSVTGVLVGAFIGSSFRGLFRWEACEDPRELGRQVFGAALMGVGGVVALGCSIGQGITAFSTLAFSAPITLAAICAGAIVGLRRLVAGFQPE